MLFLQFRQRRRTACNRSRHDINSQGYHANIADLGYEWYCAGSTRVGFENVNLVVFYGILHVHQADDVHFDSDLACIFVDEIKIFPANRTAGDNAGTVTRVNACQFDMFHDSRHEGIRTVTDSIGFTFEGIVEETVNEDRPVRRHTDSRFHIICHRGFVVNNFHASSAQNVRRPYHNRIPDFGCNSLRFGDCCGHA